MPPLGIIAGDPKTDGAALLFRPDGAVPTFTGKIDGKSWLVGGDAVATVDGRQGTFSGTDAVTRKTVEGNFTCQ